MYVLNHWNRVVVTCTEIFVLAWFSSVVEYYNWDMQALGLGAQWSNGASTEVVQLDCQGSS